MELTEKQFKGELAVAMGKEIVNLARASSKLNIVQYWRCWNVTDECFKWNAYYHFWGYPSDRYITDRKGYLARFRGALTFRNKNSVKAAMNGVYSNEGDEVLIHIIFEGDHIVPDSFNSPSPDSLDKMMDDLFPSRFTYNCVIVDPDFDREQFNDDFASMVWDILGPAL